MSTLLYRVFEEHLFKVESSPDVTTNVFIEGVVEAYIGQVSKDGFHIPWKMKDNLIEDLRDEVLDMVRKKTYGYSSIREFIRDKKKRAI